MNSKKSVSKTRDQDSRPTAIQSIEIVDNSGSTQNNNRDTSNIRGFEQVKPVKNQFGLVNTLSPFKTDLNENKDVMKDYENMIAKEVPVADFDITKDQNSNFKTKDKGVKFQINTESAQGTDEEDINNSK